MNGKMIYHYTSLEAFCKILGHSEKYMGLRMSSRSYLNDTSEYTYSIPIIAKLIKLSISILEKEDFKITDTINGVVKEFEFLSKLSNEQQSFYFSNNVLPVSNNLSVSFSKRIDYLPMWGRYADNGDGIAIGINLEKLTNLISDSPNDQIFNVDYCAVDSDNYKKHLIEIAKREFKESTNVEICTNRLIISFCNIFKNPHFEYEDETRIVTIMRTIDKDCQYRVADGVIIPFKTLEINKDYIDEIIIGPNKYPHLSKQSVRDFLMNNFARSWNSDMIKNSNIPLRK